jgi:hypothetical protein
MKLEFNLVRVLPSHCFQARPGQHRDTLNWKSVIAVAGAIGVLVLLVCLHGCGAAIPGAEREVTYYDVTTGKPLATWRYTGDDMKAAGIVFQAGTGRYWRGKDINDTDTVSQYQAQAFMAGITLANNLAAAVASKTGATIPAAPIPTFVPAPVAPAVVKPSATSEPAVPKSP